MKRSMRDISDLISCKIRQDIKSRAKENTLSKTRSNIESGTNKVFQKSDV